MMTHILRTAEWRRVALVALPLALTLAFVGWRTVTAVQAPVAERSFPVWAYTTRETAPGHLTSMVRYDRANVEQLRAYVRENVRLAADLRQQGMTGAEAVVTLADPMPLDQVRAWTAARGLPLQAYALRLGGPKDGRVTMGRAPAPSNGAPAPPSSMDAGLDDIVTHLQRDRGAGPLRGVYSRWLRSQTCSSWT
jgi:hypothetical protein